MAISSSPLESIFSGLKINARFYQLIEKQTRFEYELVFIGYISAILLCRLAFLNLILTLSKKEKTATCRQYIISIGLFIIFPSLHHCRDDDLSSSL